MTELQISHKGINAQSFSEHITENKILITFTVK